MKILITVIILIANSAMALGCTSAIVSGNLTANGRPILWKHRDTSTADNVIDSIPASNGKFGYVALFNANDKLRKEAWIGFNSQGFAIMNTHSYNIKRDTITEMDKEGILMSEALSICRNIDDFENLLKTHKRPMRVEANFGVIDAEGNGAYFEVNNTDYVKYDIKDAPDGVIVRTNYSHSGIEEKGSGYIRESSACSLLSPYIKAKNITPATFTEYISRSFFSTKGNRDYSLSNNITISDKEFIPRPTSTATIAIEGVKKGESPMLTTMWSGVGYPPCCEIYPVWIGANGIPSGLLADPITGRSPLCDEAIAKKKEIYTHKSSVNINKLYNRNGTGYSQQVKAINAENYRKGYEELERRRKELQK